MKFLSTGEPRPLGPYFVIENDAFDAFKCSFTRSCINSFVTAADEWSQGYGCFTASRITKMPDVLVYASYIESSFMS